MPATFDCIATTTLGSTASDIIFSNIPGTFTDLMIILTGQASSAGNQDCSIRFNSDTGQSYSRQRMYSGGSVVSADKGNNATEMYAICYIGGSNTSSMFASSQINIFNYASTSVNKSMLWQWNSVGTSDPYSLMGNGLWRSNSAITSIQIYPNSASFAAGTTATLYGIKAA